jgi:hypothetical protein
MVLPWHLGKQGGTVEFARFLYRLALHLFIGQTHFPIPGVFAPFYVNSRTNKEM